MAKLLICDDSSFTRNRLKKIVAEKKFDIVEASNGKEALEKIENETPDLMLLDLLMPGLTGFDVLKELTKFENKPKVIIVSADIQQSTIEECKRLGAFAFVNKPPEPEELKSLIEKALL